MIGIRSEIFFVKGSNSLKLVKLAGWRSGWRELGGELGGESWVERERCEGKYVHK